ncbi:MAG: aconitase family protein [Burkholderiaceae bacterium]
MLSPASAQCLDLRGRVLFLSTRPELIEAQLAGIDPDPVPADALRDDVSTDEITPMRALAVFDERLARFPYTGLRCGGRNPIPDDAIRAGGFTVTVAGHRYGKGSSREHSPAAELAAGIRLVIARSFERIYRQNADNLGLFTSTDLSLVPRIRRGEPIPIDELLASRDALAAEILRHGGLLGYGRARLLGAGPASAARGSPLASPTGEAPAARVASDAQGPEPRTLAEKILRRHLLDVAGTHAASGPVPGDGCFVRAEWRFIHEYYTGMCARLLRDDAGRLPALCEPASIVAFEDHLSYAHRSELHLRNGLIPNLRELSSAHREFVAAAGLRSHGVLPEGEGSEGISHAMMAEQYALPGQVVAGTDSHTPHSGALGCLAYGVGTTDMAAAMLTGAVRITWPESLRVRLDGELPLGVTAKDVALHLLSLPSIRAGEGLGKVFEFCGDAIARMPTDERATLTNMCAELGGLSGIVAPDAETRRFLRERRGIDIDIADWMQSDPGARYAATLEVDCTRLQPMLARPGDPGNGQAIASLGQAVAIDIAYGGSCTAGKRVDFDHYHAVLRWAADRGLRVAPGVKLFLQFGTVAVRDYCVERGYLDAFERVGAEILQPACGSCANCGPGASVDPTQVTVSAINRNFPGRSGPGEVWLASAPSVAASAIAGRLTSFEALRATHS